jgi:hypothetical protein
VYDAQMQAPEDLFVQGTISMPVNESEDANTSTRMTAQTLKISSGNYKKKDDEALNLDKFMSRAGPVVEALIDENS